MQNACCMNQIYCFIYTQKIPILQQNKNPSITAANLYLDAHQHRFGFASQKSNNSAFDILQSSMIHSRRYSVPHRPATISLIRRRHKLRATTSLPMVITTPLRGDQQPPNDEDHSQDDEIERFVPLDGGGGGVKKNQPVTVPPIYFTNERDTTQRRIT